MPNRDYLLAHAPDACIWANALAIDLERPHAKTQSNPVPHSEPTGPGYGFDQASLLQLFRRA
jgi:hypothetical protein